MSGARDHIIGGIRRSLGRAAVDGEKRAALEARLAKPVRNLIPARAQVPHAEQVDMFANRALGLNITLSRVSSLAEIPGAVAEYLASNNLPTEIRMSPDASLDDIPWNDRPMLDIKRGRAEPADLVSVTPAFAGIAETATLMLTSDAARPATLNFMPDTHIAVLKAADVVGSYEDAISRLREASGREDGRFMPRTVNMITGPSRTADIALTMILGAHGPRRLHIVLVDGGET